MPQSAQQASRRLGLSAEEKVAAVGMVRSLQAEVGMQQGAVKRVAEQLGYGVESVSSWVSRPRSVTVFAPA
jgi:transposase